MILWIMRQSSKLNVFLGVLNLNEEFLPETLSFLKSYLTKKPMNLLFPFSVTIATVFAGLLVGQAIAPTASVAASTAATFLSTILILGILEHWFLVLPLPFAELWNWSLRSRPADQPVVRVAAAMPPSWSARLDMPCDPRELHDVLERVARGAFGEVDRVAGMARSGSGWVQFYVADGRSGITDVAPREHEEPCVVAFGRIFDQAGLQAAFARCGMQAAA
jgi:hypothetical protein